MVRHWKQAGETLAENFDNKTEKKTLLRNYKVEKAENTTIKIKVGQLKIFNLLWERFY